MTARDMVLDYWAGVRRTHHATYADNEDGARWTCDCGASGGFDLVRKQGGVWTHMDEVRLTVIRDLGWAVA